MTAVRREVSLLASVLELLQNTFFMRPRRGQEVGFETEINDGLIGSHFAVCVDKLLKKFFFYPPAVVGVGVGVSVGAGAAGL